MTVPGSAHALTFVDQRISHDIDWSLLHYAPAVGERHELFRRRFPGLVLPTNTSLKIISWLGAGLYSVQLDRIETPESQLKLRYMIHVDRG